MKKRLIQSLIVVLMTILIVGACQKDDPPREEARPIIFSKDESPCTKDQKVLIDQFIPNPKATIDELLTFLLKHHEAKSLPICTKI